MWLTKNEKRVLKLLIDNAKLSDTSIAHTLNISSQAVGRIRKKLEEEIIKGYTVELDLKKLGLNFLSVLEIEHIKESEKEVQEKLVSCPDTISLFKLIHGTKKYKIIRVCSDLEEYNKWELTNNELIKISNIQIIPLSNILKEDIKPILHKTIDGLRTKTTKIKW